MPHIDAFKHSLQEKMTEIGIRNGWKYDNYKKSFLIQEVRSLYHKKSSEVGSVFFPNRILAAACLSQPCSIRGLGESQSRSCEIHSMVGRGASCGPEADAEGQDTPQAVSGWSPATDSKC